MLLKYFYIYIIDIIILNFKHYVFSILEQI